MNKKTVLLVLSMTMLAMVLAGCSAGSGNILGATQAPTVTFTPQTATTSPMNTMTPMNTTGMNDNQMGNDAGGMLSGESAKTDSAGMTNGVSPTSSGSMTPADAGKLAEKIADAVERISEIDDAEVIVRDERALVAVEFDDQYSAGLDERMKTQIIEAVKKVDEKITEVEVTDDSTLYGQVKSLAERIGKATGFDELADDIGDLWNRVTGR